MKLGVYTNYSKDPHNLNLNINDRIEDIHSAKCNYAGPIPFH